jgi:hypothetical protein
MFRKLDIALKLSVRAAATVAAAASLLSVAPADAQTRQVFGVGEPASISELPDGTFRSALEALPPQARGRALGILKQSNVPVEDFDFMRVDPRGNIFYVDPSFEAEGTEEEVAPPAAITQTEVFQLHSKPGAANILYLDFDGHDLIDTAWNGYSGQSVLYMKPYSSDSDYSNFSTSELDRIAESWRRVAEDFAPFDVDVTTEEPPFTINQSTGRIEYGSNVGHILTTNQRDVNGYWVYTQSGCGCGGVAYYNGFGNSYLSPGLVFNTSLNGVSEAISHEFGHNLNLSHDGQSPGDGAYYWGHGSGAVSWGPIMGASYNVNMTQWSKGEYLNANNTQDDMAQIASLLSYRSDDHEDLLFAAATPLVIMNNTDVDSLGRVSDPSWAAFENKGVIEDRNDIDLFTMTIGAGTIDLSVTPAHHEVYLSGSRSNLDLEVTLMDNLGTVLQTSNPDLDINASINYFVPAPGTYVLEITGVGRGDPLVDGYTDYASIGQYHIHGLVPPPVVANNPPIPPTDLAAVLVDEVNVDLTWTDHTPAALEDNEVGYRVQHSVDGGLTFGTIATLSADSESYSDNNLSNGEYVYRLELFNSAGTTWSNHSLPINVVAPSVVVATSESTALGSIASGSYLNTQIQAGSETLREQHSGGKPSNRRSYLNHSWFVTGVVPGSMMELYIDASAPSNSENDNFIISYSVNGGPMTYLDTLFNGSAQDFTVALEPTISGTVEVNVVDSDPNTTGYKNTDTVTVHEITITSAGDPGEQWPVISIVAPADGTTVPGTEQLVLEATASDFEDVNLDASAVSWSSDVQGYLTMGSPVAVWLSSGTPPVTHVITGSVTDSADNTSMDSIIVHVSDVPVAESVSVADLDGDGVAARGNKWRADVKVTVLNNLGAPVIASVVSGSWSVGANGSGSCTTEGDGTCTISKSGLKSNVPAVTFAITAITGTLTYVWSDNTDPDGDSDGTTITVTAP